MADIPKYLQDAVKRYQTEQNISMNPEQQKGFFTKFKEYFLGTPGQERQFQQYTPEQRAYQGEFLNTAGPQILQGLQQQGGVPRYQQPQPFQYSPLPNLNFEPIANEARRNFQTNTIPTLAERFTALGGQGGQRSSAFQGALGAAGAGLNSQLAALGAQFGHKSAFLNLQQQQAQAQANQHAQALGQQGYFGEQSRINNLLGIGLGRQFEPAYLQGQPGMVQQINQAFAQGAGQMAPYAGAMLMGI